MHPTITGELGTLLTGVAFAPCNDQAFLRITGPDATRWLNGMVTNNIAALPPGKGNYNFLLSAQGRIMGDCLIYREPLLAPAQPSHTHHSELNRSSTSQTAALQSDPSFLLQTSSEQLEPIRQLLDKFIIMDDVELTPGLNIGNNPTATSPVGMSIVGPQCPDLLSKLMTARKDFAALPPLPPAKLTPAHFEGHEVVILTSPVQNLPRYEIWCSDRSIFDELFRALDLQGIPQASPEALEALRILEARPSYGTDIRNSDKAKDLPQETNQPHALHFAKGCYLGQEIVERIRSRGQVHRLFTPFRLQGTPPTAFPTPLEANGKPAGELTSAISVPTANGPVHLALGYARREALDTSQPTQTPLTYPGGAAHPRQPGQLT